MTVTHAPEDVLVIGAGPAGIASAYALTQAGISYKVIDRADIVASTWASLYPSLNLNTTRWFSHMTDEPFPRHYPIFPSGKQYHQYITDYVAQRNFNIQFGVTVHDVAPEGDLWRVETDHGTWLYKAVISATGIFNNPIMPHIAGMENFTGQLMHAHDFRDPEQVRGKRVLVVGNGPSGTDIAVASGKVADFTAIGIRSGVVLKRRYPLGVPVHGWLMLTERLPKRWCRWLLKKLTDIGYGDTSVYGLNPPPPGQGGLTAYRGPELLDAVKAGQVTPLPAPVGFNGREVTFADGQCQVFDVVIMATGYMPVLHHYLKIPLQYNDDPYESSSPCDWEIGPNGQRGWPLRDTSTHPNGRQVAGYPGLYLVGTFYKGKGAMFNFNIEAQIAAQQIQQYLA